MPGPLAGDGDEKMMPCLPESRGIVITGCGR